MHLADLQPTHRPSLLKPPIFLTRQSLAAYYQGMGAKRSRPWLDRRDRFAVVAFQMLAAVVVLAAAGLATTVTVAGEGGSDTDRSWPVYQRKATVAAPDGGQRFGRGRVVARVSAEGEVCRAVRWSAGYPPPRRSFAIRAPRPGVRRL